MFLQGCKIVKVAEVGGPDRFLVDGLCGVYLVHLELTRMEGNQIKIEGYDKVTRVQIRDQMSVSPGPKGVDRLQGNVFYMNKDRQGVPYLNLIQEGESGTGDESTSL